MAIKYTLVIGTKDWSSWSLRPYMALRAIGVPFAEDLIRLRRDSTSQEVQRRSVSGHIPVLQVEENAAIWSVWDSLAICETLAERHPETKLWPDDARARAEARAVSAEMHSGFADVRDQMTMDFARRHFLPDLREATKAQVARILRIWTDGLTTYGGPFLFGRFSIADCMYAPVCSRFRTYGVDIPASAQAYVERIFKLPAMVDWGKDAQREVDDGLA